MVIINLHAHVFFDFPRFIDCRIEGEATAETLHAVSGESASLSRRQEDPALREAESELLCESEELLAGYKKALEILQDVGAVSAVAKLKNEIRNI